MGDATTPRNVRQGIRSGPDWAQGPPGPPVLAGRNGGFHEILVDGGLEVVYPTDYDALMQPAGLIKQLVGIDAVLAPNINLARSPLAGRAFEDFSFRIDECRLDTEEGHGGVAGLQGMGAR